LRVHDVKPAMETIQLFAQLEKLKPKSKLL